MNGVEGEKASRLRTLSLSLAATRDFWSARPFEDVGPPWASTHGPLTEFLGGLSITEVARLRQDERARLAALAPFIPEAEELMEWSELPRLEPLRPTEDGRDLEDHALYLGVSGSKARQVREFVGRVPRAGNFWIDWCSGKGHLARAIEQRHAKVLCIEKDTELCRAGSERAGKDNLAMEFLQADVLAERSLIVRDSHALALHACGDLHLELIRQVVEAEAFALSFAPCCYHRTEAVAYEPLSVAARSVTVPNFDREDLRMVGQQSFGPGRRASRLREMERIDRLGFDSLQREVSGVDAYLRVPSVPKSILQEGFEGFCRWAADKRGVVLPEGLDFEHWEQVARARGEIVERAELVLDLFRRPLEVYLLLDRACHLEEAGYEVQMGEFCEREVTPRNVMIQGQRR